jgi:hypothetical protein
MSTLKPLVLLAGISAVSATGARAQTSALPPTATGTPPTTQGMPMSGMPMGPMQEASEGMPMGMTQMMTGQNSMAGHIEGRIAFLTGCGKSRDFGKTVMKRARNGSPGLIKSTGYEGAKGDESGWKHHRPTFSAAC